MNAHAALAALVGGSVLLLSAASPAQVPAGQPGAKAAVAKTNAPSRPAWQELTAAQREALAPLADRWESLDADSKRKWLEVAARYPNLAPDGKQRLHQRMAEFAKLTPEQRRTARENFRRAYELPADQRQEKLNRYQSLPDDKKRELAGKAGEKSAKKSDASRPDKSSGAPAR